MPRRLRFVLFSGMILTTMLISGVMAGASPQEVESRQAEVGSAQERLEEIRMGSAAAYEAYNAALYQLNELDVRIGATEEELAVAEERMREAQASMEERASQVYRSGNLGFLDVLVGANSFAEFSSRMNIWLRLLAEEQARFAEMRQAAQEVEAQKAELEGQRAERVSALEEAGAQRDLARNAESEAQAYLDSLSGELQAAIEEEEARQAEEARLAAQEAAANAEPEIVLTSQTQAQPDLAAEREAALEARQQAEDLAAQQQAAEQAAAEAERQAELAAERQASEEEAARRQAEAEAAREAAEQAAIEQEAAERAAAQQAAAEQAAAAQQAAAEQAAAEQAAADQAAADQAAAEQAAAEQAATEQVPVENVSDQTAPPAAGGATPPASGGSANGGGVVAAAQAQLGVPYVWGGADPSGFDCSGLVMYVMAQFGVSLPHNAQAQFGYGSPGSGAAGDVVFWGGGGGITHNGIATGNGTVIHAPYPGTVVREEGIWGGVAGYRTMV